MSLMCDDRGGEMSSSSCDTTLAQRANTDLAQCFIAFLYT